MEALDTNVIVRLLVRDDEDQFQRAEQVFRQAIASGGVWIASVVIIEVSWVLRVAYKFDRHTIADALRRLHASAGVYFEDEPTTLRALAAFEAGPADLSDYVILECAARANALPLYTFDKDLARARGAKLIP